MKTYAFWIILAFAGITSYNVFLAHRDHKCLKHTIKRVLLYLNLILIVATLNDMFKLIVIALLGVLFYTSTPARNVTADLLTNTANIIRK